MSSAASRAALRAQAATNAEVAAQIKQATFCQATLVSGETCLKIDVTERGLCSAHRKRDRARAYREFLGQREAELTARIDEIAPILLSVGIRPPRPPRMDRRETVELALGDLELLVSEIERLRLDALTLDAVQ